LLLGSFEALSITFDPQRAKLSVQLPQSRWNEIDGDTGIQAVQDVEDYFDISIEWLANAQIRESEFFSRLR
jgi:hypothetical protein